MPTHQELLTGQCSQITGQVVQQVAEVVRLGPLNWTVGGLRIEGFLTLAMYKHHWNFDSICFFPEITIMQLYINFIHNYKMLLVPAILHERNRKGHLMLSLQTAEQTKAGGGQGWD